MVTGTKIQPDNALGNALGGALSALPDQGQEQPQKVDSEPTIVLTLICAVAGLGLCFVPGQDPPIAAGNCRGRRIRLYARGQKPL